jgi:ATP-citrate lyase beta-subunit
VDGAVHPLDLVAKVDDTAAFECAKLWGGIELPMPFGREYSPEERFIEELDAKTGASLKLSILNPAGRIWTMVAGGGASVIFADTISDLGHGAELANYGEYSGNPTADATYNYAKTILDLMTREKDAKGRKKILLIGGGIANFTDVAKTFTGIFKALREYSQKLKDVDTEIWVRRAGPNYKLALEQMEALGEKLGIPTHVYGPETHMTNVVSMALK